MVIGRNKMKAKDGIIQIKLPDEYKDKTVEVEVRLENEIAEKLLIDRVKIDTRTWKLNREGIYDGSMGKRGCSYGHK
jgi:hypothetical protein